VVGRGRKREMKAAVLIARLKDGKLVAKAAESLVPLLALAKKGRETGNLDGNEVTAGTVLASWVPQSVKRFKVAAKEAPAKKAPAKKAPAKKKA